MGPATAGFNRFFDLRDFVRLSQDQIKLERPLFYNNPLGLRFELGPTEVGFLDHKQWLSGIHYTHSN